MSARLFPLPHEGGGCPQGGRGWGRQSRPCGHSEHHEYAKAHPLMEPLTNRLSPQAGKSLVIPNPSSLMSRRDGIPWGKGEGLKSKESTA
ncbi:MAG: hypothetical protein QG662_1416 [Pseudomonadota bacterium]|nr:hypothetical protein [Pseudomonadota bacterium]